MKEPVYTYVKGEGWVTRPEPRPFPWSDLNEICNTCGKRAGLHGVLGNNEKYMCPPGDSYTYNGNTLWS